MSGAAVGSCTGEKPSGLKPQTLLASWNKPKAPRAIRAVQQTCEAMLLMKHTQATSKPSPPSCDHLGSGACICVYVYVYVYVYVCTYVGRSVGVCVCVFLCVCVQVWLCVRVYVCVYACMYVHPPATCLGLAAYLPTYLPTRLPPTDRPTTYLQT